MTLEMWIIALTRVAGSLPVLRWPFYGAILAIVVDQSDVLLMNLLDLGGVGNYQTFDKYVDQVYIGCFLAVALRWQGADRNVAVALYIYRLAGFLAFEVTQSRDILLLFPNLFEFWFLFVAALHHRRTPLAWTTARLALALGALLALKELQEWALHWAKLFDSISALEAIDLVWRWLTGR